MSIQIAIIYTLLIFALTISDVNNNTVPHSSISGASENNTIGDTSGYNAKIKSAEIPDLDRRIAETICTHPKCFMKCCPSKMFFNTKLLWIPKSSKYKQKTVCESYHSDRNISEIDNLDTELINVFIEKHNLSNFEMKVGVFRWNKTFRSNTIRYADLPPNFNVYLNDQADVMLESPNSYNRWVRLPNDNYCLEFENVGNESVIDLKPGIWIIYEEQPKEVARINSTLMTCAMLVSCFFLLLVLLLHGFFPEMRVGNGVIHMSYVTCQLLAYLLLATMRIQSENMPAVCVILTYLIHFFFLASFSWLNVMAYDIWWTFTFKGQIPIHQPALGQRGELLPTSLLEGPVSQQWERNELMMKGQIPTTKPDIKWVKYFHYAWGLPFTMTTAMGAINCINMKHLPWFVTPKIPSDSCFMKGGEKFIYLYTPMLVLNLINWIFFIMTVINILRDLIREARRARLFGNSEPSHYHGLDQPWSVGGVRRLLILLKLSVLMGLSFGLEVVSYMYPNSNNLWFISDLFNSLIGVTIFILFGYNHSVMKKLINLFTCWKSTSQHYTL